MAKIEDFNDEEAVLAEMAKELDIDPDDLEIDDDGRGLSGFGEGTVYLITIRGGRNNKEWCVAESDDAAREVALAVVKQDLEQEPEIFGQDFIASHIDMKHLRDELEADVQSGNDDYARDLSDREFWKEAARQDLEMPEEDEDGELPEPTDDDYDALAEAMTEDQLKDPMGYLEDIYGKGEAVAQAIKIAGIDEDAAAEDAVDTDGWQHFLAAYDGNSHETKSGLVYWRAN